MAEMMELGKKYDDDDEKYNVRIEEKIERIKYIH